MRLASAESGSNLGTRMSVTRNTTCSGAVEASALPAASLAVWNTASTAAADSGPAPSPRSRILDLVVDVEGLGLGPRGCELVLELGRHVLERANLFRLGFHGLHEHRAEATLNRRADFALFQRECGVRHRRVDHCALRDRAEIDVLFGLAQLLGDIDEARPFGDSVCRGLCRLGAGKIDLQNVAALRSDIARAAFLVGALEV